MLLPRQRALIRISSGTRTPLFALLIALILSSLFTPSSPAAASGLRQAAQTRDTALGSFTAGADLVLRGSSARASLTIPLYPHWRIEAGSELRLTLRYSPLLLADLSTLSVSMDGTPLNAVRLDPAGAGGTNITIALPAMQPTDSQITLDFAASLRSNNAQCPDPNDPAAYVVVAKESTLHLNYTPLARDLQVQRAMDMLLAGHYLPGNRIVFVLPQAPEYADWQAASIIAARLGQLAGADGVNIEVLPPVAPIAADLGNANVVFVGGASLLDRVTLPDFPITESADVTTATFALNGQAVPSGDGILAVASLPWSQDGIALMVAGDTSEALLAAARTLLDPDRLALLQSASATIPASAQTPASPDRTPVAAGSSATFEQLGLSDQTIYGMGTRSISQTVFLPPSWQIDSDSDLTLDFSYSDMVLADQATLTVLLNNLPVATLNMSARPVGAGQKRSAGITVPKTAWRAGDNTLEFRFTLQTTATAICAAADDPNVYATIYKSSVLDLHYGVDRTRRVDLGLYPYPFSGAGAGQDPARVVLPYDPSVAEQAAALRIVAELARFTSGTESLPQVVPADRSEAAKYNYDMILLGGPERNPLSKELNPRLPIVWNGNTAQTLRTDWGVIFPSSGQGDLALMQEALSPWNPNRLVLDAGYTRPGLINRVVAAIGQNLAIGKYRGNVLVIDLDGKVTSIDTTAPPTVAATAEPTSVPATVIETKPVGNAFLPVLALVFSILLLGVVILLIRYIPRRTAPRET